MGVETTIREIADELEKIATTKTVVGEPITAAGKTIVPISRITMGFGAGGEMCIRDRYSARCNCFSTWNLYLHSTSRNYIRCRYSNIERYFHTN